MDSFRHILPPSRLGFTQTDLDNAAPEPPQLSPLTRLTTLTLPSTYTLLSCSIINRPSLDPPPSLRSPRPQRLARLRRLYHRHRRPPSTSRRRLFFHRSFAPPSSDLRFATNVPEDDIRQIGSHLTDFEVHHRNERHHVYGNVNDDEQTEILSSSASLRIVVPRDDNADEYEELVAILSRGSRDSLLQVIHHRGRSTNVLIRRSTWSRFRERTSSSEDLLDVRRTQSVAYGSSWFESELQRELGDPYPGLFREPVDPSFFHEEFGTDEFDNNYEHPISPLLLNRSPHMPPAPPQLDVTSPTPTIPLFPFSLPTFHRRPRSFFNIGRRSSITRRRIEEREDDFVYDITEGALNEMKVLRLNGSTDSTSCSETDEVRSRRKHIKHSLGRAKEVYKMLGRFEDFFADSMLKRSKNQEGHDQLDSLQEPIGPPPTRCSELNTPPFVFEPVSLDPIPPI